MSHQPAGLMPAIYLLFITLQTVGIETKYFFFEIFHAVASWFGQFHTILQGGFGNQIYSSGQNFAMQRSL